MLRRRFRFGSCGASRFQTRFKRDQPAPHHHARILSPSCDAPDLIQARGRERRQPTKALIAQIATLGMSPRAEALFATMKAFGFTVFITIS
jgi:hypothetical protein